MNDPIRQELITSVGLDLPETNWKIRLLEEIRYLLEHDFHKLISILYRMDVSEGKLRGLLQNQPEADAAELIAGLMLERVAQRQQTKTTFKQPKAEDDNEEKW